MGTVERKAREKEQRRQQILNAARRLFLQKGFAATTMPEIAAEAELAPGTLYLYFPSKENLYLELLDEGYELFHLQLQRGIDPGGSPRQQAGNFIDNFFRFARDNAAYFDIIFFVVQREGRFMAELFKDDDLHRRLTAREEQCKELAARLMRATGRFSGSADLERAVNAVWSMLAGVVLYFGREKQGNFDPVAREAKRLILEGLFTGARGKGKEGSAREGK